MSAEKAEGLVIRITDFSETSRVVVFFTREFGKLSALAKGGRRLRGPFESALDLLATCRIVFLRKSSSSLDLLTEAQLVRPFRPRSHQLEPYYTGYYVAELLQGLTEDYDPHPRLYSEAANALERLSTREDWQRTILRFELVLLQELGQLPCMETCAECGERIEQAAYWLMRGGLMCSRCHESEPRGHRIQLGTLAVMKRLSDDDSKTQERVQVSAQQLKETQHILANTISHILGRRPKTLRYLQF